VCCMTRAKSRTSIRDDHPCPLLCGLPFLTSAYEQGPGATEERVHEGHHFLDVLVVCEKRCGRRGTLRCPGGVNTERKEDVVDVVVECRLQQIAQRHTHTIEADKQQKEAG